MPKPDASPSAVVVSGGKQYRIAPGDRVLVDRLPGEPGTSVRLDRVLLFNDGTDVTVGSPVVAGAEVEAKVLAHRRGPRIEVLRYKSKKRVRVHRGARADLTALEIVTVVGPVKEATGDGESSEEPSAGDGGRKRATRKPRTAKASKETR